MRMIDHVLPKQPCFQANIPLISLISKQRYHQIDGTVEPLSTDSSLLWTVSNVLTKFSYMQIFLKKPLLFNGLSLMRTNDTKSRPQRVNSCKLDLFITDTAVIRWIPNLDQVSLHRVNPVWLMSYARWFQKPSRYISNNNLQNVYRETH